MIPVLAGAALALAAASSAGTPQEDLYQKEKAPPLDPKAAYSWGDFYLGKQFEYKGGILVYGFTQEEIVEILEFTEKLKKIKKPVQFTVKTDLVRPSISRIVGDCPELKELRAILRKIHDVSREMAMDRDIPMEQHMFYQIAMFQCAFVEGEPYETYLAVNDEMLISLGQEPISYEEVQRANLIFKTYARTAHQYMQEVHEQSTKENPEHVLIDIYNRKDPLYKTKSFRKNLRAFMCGVSVSPDYSDWKIEQRNVGSFDLRHMDAWLAQRHGTQPLVAAEP